MYAGGTNSTARCTAPHCIAKEAYYTANEAYYTEKEAYCTEKEAYCTAALHRDAVQRWAPTYLCLKEAYYTAKEAYYTAALGTNLSLPKPHA